MYILRKVDTEEYVGKIVHRRFLTTRENCKVYPTLKGAKSSVTTFKLFENGKRIEVKLEIITI